MKIEMTQVYDPKGITHLGTWDWTHGFTKNKENFRVFLKEVAYNKVPSEDLKKIGNCFEKFRCIQIPEHIENNPASIRVEYCDKVNYNNRTILLEFR